VAQARAQVEMTKTDLERTLVRAPVVGDVLQVNVRPGEYVGTPPGQALIVLGKVHQLHVRVDIDEQDIWRFRPTAPARAFARGNPRQSYALTFVRVEPYVIPKKSLTGDNTERVDTRVLQVIYALGSSDGPIYVGQQVDVFTEATAPAGDGTENRVNARQTI
jgi:multidrug resistance efflux pump